MNWLPLVRSLRFVTSRVPRIRGVGFLLRLIARSFRGVSIPEDIYDVNGISLKLSPSDMIGNELIFLPQYFDFRERDLLTRIVKEGDLVVEIGANIGQYTVLLSKMVGGKGHILAIEAETHNFIALTKNLSLNGALNVSLENVGVSDRRETLPLLLNSTGNNGGHSFFEQSDTSNPPLQMVTCLPLAEVLSQFRCPDFMKLDIEGFEFRVLKGFFDATNRSRWPKTLMIEDIDHRREGDAVELCIQVGYSQIERFDSNVFLSLKTT